MIRDRIIALCRRRGKPLLTQMMIDLAVHGSDRTTFGSGVELFGPELIIFDEASTATPEMWSIKMASRYR